MIASIDLTASSLTSAVSASACSASVLTPSSIASFWRSLLGLKFFSRSEANSPASRVSAAPCASGFAQP
jgi:hypothetical protein